MKAEGAKAIRRGAGLTQRLHMWHAACTEGPHGASALACQLACDGRRGRCLPLLQQCHCSIEAGLL